MERIRAIFRSRCSLPVPVFSASRLSVWLLAISGITAFGPNSVNQLRVSSNVIHIVNPDPKALPQCGSGSPLANIQGCTDIRLVGRRYFRFPADVDIADIRLEKNGYPILTNLQLFFKNLFYLVQKLESLNLKLMLYCSPKNCYDRWTKLAGNLLPVPYRYQSHRYHGLLSY